MRTRIWMSESGSNTVVQFRTDVPQMIWIHTNLGWIPDGDCPTDEKAAETKCERLAEGWKLVEQSEEVAKDFLGELDPRDIGPDNAIPEEGS